MKLKSCPEDFAVEELTTVEPTDGPFALYRLCKSGLGTPEAMQEILHRWNLPRDRLSYGGLKDRHAQTTQYLTIHRGPRQGISERSFTLEYLGQTTRPFHAKDIVGNRFTIRLRDIPIEHEQEWDRRLACSQESGLVNYFDDQRFGSIGFAGELIGVPWCKGDYERALYLAIAEPNSHDRPREREQKGILREHWGQWVECKERLDRSHRRSIVTYLVDHPTDFKRAMALVRQDLRSLYLAAFQSWVWNRWVSALLETQCDGAVVAWLSSVCGRLALPFGGGPGAMASWRQLASWKLPLPSSRVHAWPQGTEPALESVLMGLGLNAREMRLKYPRDTFFSRGERPLALRVEGVEATWHSSSGSSERRDWLLRFDLPRGAYATMAIRQWTLQGGDWELEGEEGEDGSRGDL